LNAGYKHWINDDLEVTTEIAEYAKENYSIDHEIKELIRNYEQILENIEIKKETLIDARDPADHNKIGSNGKPAHIPGSVNVPFNELLNPLDGTLKSKNEILDCNY
jgi:thiosulfate/3-mercaptopyruvate sulfurtransferase